MGMMHMVMVENPVKKMKLLNKTQPSKSSMMNQQKENRPLKK